MTKNQLLFFILQMVLWTMIMSCSSTRTYQRVNNVIYPEKRLPDQTSKITILNTVPQKETPYTDGNNLNRPSGDIVVDPLDNFGTSGKQGYLVNRAVVELKRGKFYLVEKKVLPENEIKQWNDSKVNDHINSDQEVLLVLEYLNSDYDFKSEKIRKHQLDQAGNDYYIDAYEASRNYVVHANWNIYDGIPSQQGSIKGKLIYQITNYGEKKIKSQGLHKDQTIEKLDSISYGVERFLLDSLAEELAYQIIPKKIFDSWSYYVKGSDELKNGHKYMGLDKLEEARKIYQSGLRSAKDSKIEARLNYNMAIIHDVLGDTNLALEYAEKAVLADDKYLHKSLYDKLKLKMEINARS